MDDTRRQYQRLQKKLTIRFCLPDIHPVRWDMSIVDNISVGGVKFSASNEVNLNNRRLRMQIKLPELVPDLLELEAIVLSSEQLFNGKSCTVRARFINLSETDKYNLRLLENIINANLKSKH